jgi:rhamnosyltransferase
VISVVIPVKNGGMGLVRCLEGIASQEIDDEVEVVVVDSGSSDGSVERARGLGAQVHEIGPGQFVHGATRNLAARLSRGEVLVFTVQDAVPFDKRWLSTLVGALQGDDVAGAYGRQLPHEDASPPERFFLDFMYGPTARIQRLANVQELTFEQTLFSNVNSAIPRRVWESNPFHDDVTMSEDQEWSRRMLLCGQAIAYEPLAAVRHSHAYSLASAFGRFYASGASADRAYVAGDTSRAALRHAMRRYAREELRWLWRTRQRRWIPYTLIYELSKWAGLQLGLRRPART